MEGYVTVRGKNISHAILRMGLVNVCDQPPEII